jgi:predicted nucleic acid-binding protein
MRFIDANIFLRYLTRDDQQKADACASLIRAIGEGTIPAWTSDRDWLHTTTSE